MRLSSLRRGFNFDKSKEAMLKKLGEKEYHDKSKKGSVDEEIIPLLHAINQLPDYFTTSSCAGRIILFKEPFSGKKHEGEWLFVSHEPTTLEDVMGALLTLPEERVWFRQEAVIVHVIARTIEKAFELVNLAISVGLKKSCIKTKSKRGRILVEIVGNEHIDSLISANKALLVTKDYLSLLVTVANERLLLTRKRAENLRLKLLELNNQELLEKR